MARHGRRTKCEASAGRLVALGTALVGLVLGVPARGQGVAGPAAPQYQPAPQYAAPAGPTTGGGPAAPAAVATLPAAPGGVTQPVPEVEPPAPFELTPQEAAELEQLLLAWQHQSGQVQTFTCDFVKWEYDPAFGPRGPQGEMVARTVSRGEIKYAAPDRGIYRDVQTEVFTPKADAPGGGSYVVSDQPGEHWVCDGQAIYEFRPDLKELREYRLPPEYRGKAISDGPLPFIFGVEAAKLKQRYWMRITERRPGEIWLIAYPRRQQDRANFTAVELILSDRDLMPQAMQLHLPNGTPAEHGRKAYRFANHKPNDALANFQDFLGVFVAPRTPPFWRRIVQESPPAAGEAPQVPPPASRPGPSVIFGGQPPPPLR